MLIFVVALIISDNKVFACKSIDGKWRFPSGIVRDGEAPVDAIKRIVWDEHRAKIKVGKIQCDIHCSGEDATYYYLYDCSVTEFVTPFNSHNEIKWFSIDELKTVKWNWFESIFVDTIRHRDLSLFTDFLES